MKQFLSMVLSFALILSVAMPVAAYGPNDIAMDQALTAQDMASAIGGKLITGWHPIGAECTVNSDGSLNGHCYINLNDQGQLLVMVKTGSFSATFHATAGSSTNDLPGSPWVVPANTGTFISTTSGYTWGQIFQGGVWQGNHSVIFLYGTDYSGGFDLKSIDVTDVGTGALCTYTDGGTQHDLYMGSAFTSNTVCMSEINVYCDNGTWKAYNNNGWVLPTVYKTSYNCS